MLALGFTLMGVQSCATASIVQGPAGAIAYVDEGRDGLPVVLLHSFGGDRSHWEHVRKHLKQRVITVELRGHGRSAMPADGDFRISSMAADVAAVADSLHLKRFVLIGHSMGGSIALEYAGLHPDRVAGLVLVDAAGDPMGMPAAMREGIKRSLNSEAYEQVVEDYWNQILAGSRDEVRAKVLADMRRIPRSMVVSVTSELLDYDPLPALKRYSGPALAVVVPGNDGPSALHHLRRPAIAHRVISQTGHWLHLDRPGEFQEILDPFLASVK